MLREFKTSKKYCLFFLRSSLCLIFVHDIFWQRKVDKTILHLIGINELTVHFASSSLFSARKCLLLSIYFSSCTFPVPILSRFEPLLLTRKCSRIYFTFFSFFFFSFLHLDIYTHLVGLVSRPGSCRLGNCKR